MAIIKPVYGPDYGKIIANSFGVYNQVNTAQKNHQLDKDEEEAQELLSDPEIRKNPKKLQRLLALNPKAALFIQQQSQKNDKAAETAEIKDLTLKAQNDPNALKTLMLTDPVRAQAIQKMQIETNKRFRRERAYTAKAVEGLDLEQQKGVLQSRIQMIQNRGGDPSNTQNLLNMLNGSSEEIDQGQRILKQAVFEGEQEGFIKPDEGATSEIENYQWAYSPENVNNPAATAYRGKLENPKTPTMGKPFTALVEGEQRLVRLDNSGGVIPIQGALPVPDSPSRPPAPIRGQLSDGTPAFFDRDIETGELVKVQGASPLKTDPQKIEINTGDVPESYMEFFNESQGKNDAKYYSKIREDAINAQDGLATLEEMEAIDVRQGGVEPVKQQIGRVLDGIGIDVSSIVNVPAGNAYNAQAGKLLVNQMASAKGVVSDADLAVYKNTIPRIENHAKANEFIINSSKAYQQRKIDKAVFFEEYLKEKGNIINAESDWRSKIREEPFISKHRKPGGLPLFYDQFKKGLKETNPGITDEQIRIEWTEYDSQQNKK